jgi:hypothetical protein
VADFWNSERKSAGGDGSLVARRGAACEQCSGGIDWRIEAAEVQMSEPTQVTLTLHGDAVVAPALRAIEESVDVVSFCMRSLEKADLSKPQEFESSRFQMKFTGTNVGAEERKTRYTNWVLSKGFQDLARGIRGMLEEAYFYISMMDFLVRNSAQKTTWGFLQEKI